MRRLIPAAAIVFVVAAVSTAEATPIVYSGSLTLGITVTDTIAQDALDGFPNYYGDDPEGADYWSATLQAGRSFRVTGNRLAQHFDMDLWVFFNPAGLYTNTTQFGGFLRDGLSFNPTAGFVARFQDEQAHAGPFGDPSGVFVAPFTGTYTFIVTSGLSNIGQPDSYTLQVATVPEPASVILFGMGLLLVGRLTRRPGVRTTRWSGPNRVLD